MVEATKNFVPGQTRLAIILDGKLVSAPGVRTTLGANFQIDMDDLDERALENLARRMSGRPELKPGEALPQAPPPPPRPETVPFTEEEYQQIKANREQMGIYHLESVPSKEDLDAKLQKGMDREAVIALFGQPYLMSGKPDDDTFRMSYRIAPEKREENPEDKMLNDGFMVVFSEGKVATWDFSSSNMRRERKIVGRMRGLLVASFPKVDFSSDDVDLIGMLEGIKIPNVRQQLNSIDLHELLGVAMVTHGWVNLEGKEEPHISTQCDLMKILALHFPEVQDLVEGAVDGKVTAKSLGAALSPYALEGKPLPEVEAAPADGK